MTATLEVPLKRYHYRTDLPVGEAPAYAARGPHHQRIPLHDHDFLEFELVEGGSAEHLSIHGRERVRAGHLHILHPGQWHGYEQVRELRLHDIYIPVGVFAHELSWMRLDPRLAPLVPRRMPMDDRQRRAAPQGVLSFRLEPAFFARVRACCGEIQSLVDAGGAVRQGALLARTLLLFDAIADHPAVVQAQRSTTDARVDAVCATMASNLAHPWSVAALADGVGLSQAHLMRLMKRDTGRSPIGWLTQRRAERLAVLLLTRGDCVAALGREVGWSDPSYCARRFRACLGCAPDAYRRRYPFQGAPG